MAYFENTDKNFVKANKDIPIVDKFPPLGFDEHTQLAYAEARRRGLIDIDIIKWDRATGRCTVRYKSSIPAEWTHEKLRELKQEVMCCGQVGH